MGADPCAGATKDGRILHLSLRGAAEKKFPLCCTKTCNFSLHSRRECRDLAEGGAALWSFVAVRPPPGPGAPGGGSPAAGRGSGGRGPAKADAVHRRWVSAVHRRRCVGGREARRAGRKLNFTGGIFLNQTSNYQLNQWDPEDRILRTDFNSDNAKIDAALAESAQAVQDEASARAAAINNLALTRNCRLIFMNYIGNGASTRTFSFVGTPLMINIMGMEHWVCAVQGATVGSGRYLNGGGGQKLTVSWNDKSVTISSPNSDSSYMCNWSGESYSLVAILLA